MSTSLREIPTPRVFGGALAQRALLAGLEAWLTEGSLSLKLPDGSERSFGGQRPGPAVRLEVASDDLFRRIARSWKMGLGEAYAVGDWQADDLPGLCELLFRNIEAARLSPGLARWMAFQRRRPHLPSSNTLRRARAHIRYHYDLGNDLYRLFLDESMTYSCAVWERPGETLEQAQQNKLRRICEKLQLGPADHVLEIGCGWGGFAVHAAATTGCRVTGVTISQEQHAYAVERVRAAGLADRVEILLQDYRTLEGSFTRVASIEMLEAVGFKQLPTFFRTIDRLLAPNGLVCIQTIAIPDHRFERYRRTEDWIQRYIFPGSLLPSLTALTRAATRSSELHVHGLEEIGVDYADTLREWRQRFLANVDAVRALGYDDRFVRIWEFYLASCEAAFRTRSLRDIQIVLSRSFNDNLHRYPAARATH